MRLRLSLAVSLLGLGVWCVGPLATTASAAVMVPSVEKADGVTQVRARGGGGGGGHVRGGGHYRGGYGGYYGGRRYYGGPVLLYGGPAYYGGYGSHCSWLHYKARSTGSRYWWSRYRNEC